ncbi:MAG: hypothetical protein KDC80_28470 [Saprospiraceae bacterium]|nr:hypothetical protein [Saprospiraceae bacterium]
MRLPKLKYKTAIGHSIPFLAIGTAALAFIFVIHNFLGYPVGHSLRYNLFWQEHFTEQLFAGEILPRWLFNYLDDLGAPIFYFYAPLPFYVNAFLSILFRGLLDDIGLLSLGHTAILFLSGISIYSLFRLFHGRYWSTFFAIAYMFIPYHYIDLEVRSAWGETMAYIWLPLILKGILTAESDKAYLIRVALPYTALILSHLPSALLAIPALIIFQLGTRKDSHWARNLFQLFLAGCLAVALSAFYLVPALSLLDLLPVNAWVLGQGSGYEVENWLLGRPGGIPVFGHSVYLALSLISMIALLLILFYFFSKNSIRQKLSISLISILSASGINLIVYWFFITNLSRPIWQYIEILNTVQFPYRLGVVIDFCCILIFGLLVPVLWNVLVNSLIKNQLLHLFLLRLFPVMLLFGAIAAVVWVYFPPSISSFEQIEPRNALEYRPKWMIESKYYLGDYTKVDLNDPLSAFKIHQEGISSWISVTDSLPDIGINRKMDGVEKLRVEKDTRIWHLEVFLTSPAIVTVKTLYFPHWLLEDQRTKEVVTLYPDPESGLLQFYLPEGQGQFELTRKLLREEKFGMVISGMALALFILLYYTHNNTSYQRGNYPTLGIRILK